MTKEVKRFVVDMRGHGEECVLASDYAALEQECERLSNQRDAILLQARIWACEARTQQSITREVSEALGGIPTWGPIAATVTERLAERDAALLQVEALREALAAARQDLVHVYQTGHERIVALGGHCDPVGLMVSQSPGIRAIDAALQAKP